MNPGKIRHPAASISLSPGCVSFPISSAVPVAAIFSPSMRISAGKLPPPVTMDSVFNDLSHIYPASSFKMSYGNQSLKDSERTLTTHNIPLLRYAPHRSAAQETPCLQLVHTRPFRSLALICRGTGIRRPGAVFAFAAASIFIAMVVVGNANTTFIVFSLGMLSSFPSFRFPTHYMMLVLSTIRA